MSAAAASGRRQDGGGGESRTAHEAGQDRPEAGARTVNARQAERAADEFEAELFGAEAERDRAEAEDDAAATRARRQARSVAESAAHDAKVSGWTAEAPDEETAKAIAAIKAGKLARARAVLATAEAKAGRTRATRAERLDMQRAQQALAAIRARPSKYAADEREQKQPASVSESAFVELEASGAIPGPLGAESGSTAEASAPAMPVGGAEALQTPAALDAAQLLAVSRRNAERAAELQTQLRREQLEKEALAKKQAQELVRAKQAADLDRRKAAAKAFAAGARSTPGQLLEIQRARRALENAEKREQLAQALAAEAMLSQVKPFERAAPEDEIAAEIDLIGAADAQIDRELEAEQQEAEAEAAHVIARRRGASAARLERQKKRRKREGERELGASERDRDRAWERQWERKCAAYGWPKDTKPPPLIPRRVWIMCWQIVSDETGEAGRYWWRRARRKLGGWVLSPLRYAAFGSLVKGKHMRAWCDDRARRIVALGLMLLELGQKTDQRAALGSKCMTEGLCVRGVSISALCAALTSRFRDRRLHKNTLSNSDGYLPALRWCGFLTAHQLPCHVVQQWEIGPSGHTINRYFIPTGGKKAARPNRGEGGAELGAHFGAAFAERSAFGWDFGDIRDVSTLRGYARRKALEAGYSAHCPRAQVPPPPPPAAPPPD